MGAKSRPLSDRSGRRDTQSAGTVYRVARREVQTASPEAQTASPVPRASKLALLHTMGIGTSLFLIAVGAILRFAVTVSSRDFNVQTVGLILMIVGAVGLAISLLWITVWSDRRSRSPDVVERDVPPTQRYRY